MSRTTLYTINADQDVEPLAEFTASWRSAPMLWGYLLGRLGLDDPSLPPRWGLLWGAVDDVVSDVADEAARARRAAAVQAQLFDWEWWAFMTTLERNVVAASCARELAAALRKTHAACLSRFPDRIPSSFADQAEQIERATDTDPETSGLFGFAWNQTSVSSTWPQDESGRRPNLDREGNYYLVTGLRQVEYVPPRRRLMGNPRESDRVRRGNATWSNRIRRDTNAVLDAMRINMQRFERWYYDGSEAKEETLRAAIEAVRTTVQAPRWTDEQVALLVDLVREAAQRGEELAEAMLADLVDDTPNLVWFGGNLVDDGE